MSVRASHSPFISVPFYFRVKCNCSGLVNVVAEAKCHSSVLKFLSVLSLSRFETLTSSLQEEGGGISACRIGRRRKKYYHKWEHGHKHCELCLSVKFLSAAHMKVYKKSTKNHHQQQRKHGCWWHDECNSNLCSVRKNDRKEHFRMLVVRHNGIKTYILGS